MRGQLCEVISYTIMIYNRLGRIEERDAAAISHGNLMLNNFSKEPQDEDMDLIGKLTEDIGAALATRFELFADT